MSRLGVGLILGIVLPGCGGAVQTTLSEAKSLCFEADEEFTETSWETFLVSMEALRDDGLSKSAAIVRANNACDEMPTDDQRAFCLNCYVRTIDALWQ